ncbi:hypothetical protein MCUN1_002257 [Malassezia cuniculi]|uniref:Uncharacterized protein n=1 Tax=Malassezia cuniculi TaxID=948313 RepID=A0AAF0ERA5_9BASI|nr:hypothetical protein MCUN1_002257 [Malassezia cuniculi]
MSGDERSDSSEYSEELPPIQLLFHEHEFVIFPAGTAAAPQLRVDASAFWEPLESFFLALRVDDALGEFLDEDTALNVAIPALELEIHEDDVYAQQVSLHDLFSLHLGLGHGTDLSIVVTQVPRFIARYNQLATQLNEAVGDETMYVDAEDEEDAADDYEAEYAEDEGGRNEDNDAQSAEADDGGDLDGAQDVTEEAAEGVPENATEEAAEGAPEEATEQVAEGAPEEADEDAPENTTGHTSEDAPVEASTESTWEAADDQDLVGEPEDVEAEAQEDNAAVGEADASVDAGQASVTEQPAKTASADDQPEAPVSVENDEDAVDGDANSVPHDYEHDDYLDEREDGLHDHVDLSSDDNARDLAEYEYAEEPSSKRPLSLLHDSSDTKRARTE